MLVPLAGGEDNLLPRDRALGWTADEATTKRLIRAVVLPWALYLYSGPPIDRGYLDQLYNQLESEEVLGVDHYPEVQHFWAYWMGVSGKSPAMAEDAAVLAAWNRVLGQ